MKHRANLYRIEGLEYLPQPRVEWRPYVTWGVIVVTVVWFWVWVVGVLR